MQGKMAYRNYEKPIAKKNKNNENEPTIAYFPKQQTATVVTLESAVEKPNANSLINSCIGQLTRIDKETGCWPRDAVNVIVMFTIAVIFIISLSGFFVMWFTEIYNDNILEDLVLANGTKAAHWWQEPPVNPHFNLHVFNYTNTERWLRGLDKKLRVEDLGPYVYRENFEKVNVVFNSNSTISYQEHRTYEFLPELSKGKQYDQIVFPNIVLMGAIALYPKMNYLQQMWLQNRIESPSSKIFMTESAHGLFWGYDDELLKAKNSLDLLSPSSMNKFGLLAKRNGTSKDVTTIYTGEDDIRKLSLINVFNGKPSMSFWTTEECNRIDGTDGSQFPPHLMDQKQALPVFIKTFCRKFPLYFDSEVNILDGIPAWRYKAPLNVFEHPINNSENQCYCHIESGTCPPAGVFNATKCFDDAPIFVSFPHFFTGEDSLFENIDGLNPDENLHRTYADVHPRLAFPIGGASRFQINVQAQPSSGFTVVQRFADQQILPVMWMEVMSGAISEDLRATIYHTTFSLNAIQLSLRYGSLLACLMTLTVLIYVVYYRNKRKENLRNTTEKKINDENSVSE